MEKIKIWAHRGSSHQRLENTMPAFEQAIADGADGIELDVQRSRDGELVVFHDEQLKRLTGVDGFVWDLTWAELQELTLASTKHNDGKIPLLKEVLQLISETSVHLNIELKNSINFYPKLEQEVLALVDEYKLLDQVTFSSFNHESVKRLSGLAGPEKAASLTSSVVFEPWTYLEKIGAQAYHPMLNSLQQKHLIHECQQRGIKVNVWTADSDFMINAALLSGVHAIITNRPVKAMELRAKFEEDGGQQAVQSIKDAGFPLVGGGTL